MVYHIRTVFFHIYISINLYTCHFLSLRLFGAKCDKCVRSFGKNDYVMRAKNKIFHLDCFRCSACEKQLVPGDEYSLKHEELFCKDCSLDKNCLLYTSPSPRDS